MAFLGKYVSDRDLRFINSINAEILGGILQTSVILYKVAPDQTPINLYGENDPNAGKIFYPGIEVVALIERDENLAEQSDFGPDRKQGVIFKFAETILKEVNFFPEIGDIVEFNARYHEIDNVIQEQFLGGQPDKSFSIIVHSHYSRLSKLNMMNRQI